MLQRTLSALRELGLERLPESAAELDGATRAIMLVLQAAGAAERQERSQCILRARKHLMGELAESSRKAGVKAGGGGATGLLSSKALLRMSSSLPVLPRAAVAQPLLEAGWSLGSWPAACA